MADFLEEKDKSIMGRERRSLTVSAREKTCVAYREAGRALVAWLLPETDPVQKVTIVPRANDLGTTIQVPDEGRHLSTTQHLESAVAILMARRCTEQIFLGGTTAAVANDLSEATELARRMVCEWGMAEEMGPLGLGGPEETVFLGKEIIRYRQYSEATSVRIDHAVRRVVLQGYKKARDILEGGQSTVVRLAHALLKSKTLDSGQLETLIRAESPYGPGGIRDQRGRSEPLCPLDSIFVDISETGSSRGFASRTRGYGNDD
jgi:cell division protease FtsH